MSQLPSSNRSNVCQVCGEQASIINYGVLTCSSCRTFFRRNGFNHKHIAPCRFSGHCEVTSSSRRCTACRFAKCLSVGMSRDLIRKEDLSTTRSKSNESSSELVILPQPLIRTASWTSDDWKLVSNIVHAFETFSSMNEIRRQIVQTTSTASNMSFDSNQSYRILSSFCNSLRLFISSTPDFQVLPPSEQCSLLQRNLFGVLAFGGIYLMGQSGIFDSPENTMALQPLYGMEIIERLRRIYTQFDSDSVLIKILLVALAFSSSSYTNPLRMDSFSSGTFRLFGSQNVYVELIWKYLIHRYEYQPSVERFSSLIQRILNALKLAIEIYQTNPHFQTFIDQLEQSLMVNDQTHVPLWGKT